MKGDGFMGRRARVCLLGLFAGVWAVAGCEKKSENDLIALKGRIEKVVRTTDTTGEITVRFFSDKQNQEISGKALVTPQTRIEKGGAAGTFQDLQEGTSVQGDVRVEKEGGQKKYTAVLIRVNEGAPPAGG